LIFKDFFNSNNPLAIKHPELGEEPQPHWGKCPTFKKDPHQKRKIVDFIGIFMIARVGTVPAKQTAFPEKVGAFLTR